MLEREDSLQSLERGLDVLQLMNQRGPQTVAQVARGAALPRTTTIRVLETLRRRGLVVRDDDRRYRVTRRVRILSDGYRDEEWIHAVARPIASGLAASTGWPVGLATADGPQMAWRICTDRAGPSVLRRFDLDESLPMHRCAAGLVHLAYCEALQRRTTLQALFALQPPGCEAAALLPALEGRLGVVRMRGFALVTRSRCRHHDCSVPVLSDGHCLASLVLRFAAPSSAAARTCGAMLAAVRTAAEAIGRACAASSRTPSPAGWAMPRLPSSAAALLAPAGVIQ